MSWMSCCGRRSNATASRMPWRMRSKSPAGRAATSMPARLSLRKILAPGMPMAKTDGALPPDEVAKLASPARIAAFRTGLSAESRAAAFLMAKGYRILAKRFRTPHGEIDIVARRRNLIVFIEVKARASLDEAAYAVTPRQQQRIIDAAQGWLMAHPEHADFELRFDAMLIAPRRLPRHLLAAFDVILLRQDPPFDLAYITSTHFLERLHPKTLVVNDPAGVRNAPEKLFVTNFPKLMPPTLISRDLDEINAFRDEHGAVVMKPLHGHGGAAVFRVMPQDMNFGSLYDMFSVTFREPWVIQRFLAEVKHGDKRILLVDGEFAGAVNRVPAPDDLRSNMVRGGAAEATELTPREREICETLGPALRERGLLFAGIDVIDGNLTEINVTSPTGIRAITRLGGPDVAAKIWDVIEKKRG